MTSCSSVKKNLKKTDCLKSAMMMNWKIGNWMKKTTNYSKKSCYSKKSEKNRMNSTGSNLKSLTGNWSSKMMIGKTKSCFASCSMSWMKMLAIY